MPLTDTRPYPGSTGLSERAAAPEVKGNPVSHWANTHTEESLPLGYDLGYGTYYDVPGKGIMALGKTC